MHNCRFVIVSSQSPNALVAKFTSLVAVKAFSFNYYGLTADIEFPTESVVSSSGVTFVGTPYSFGMVNLKTSDKQDGSAFDGLTY